MHMVLLSQEQDRVRLILVDVASRHTTITYTDLLRKAGIDWDMSNPYYRSELGHMLGAISAFEHQNDRPLLSSVAVIKGSNMPSEGFYKLAEELGFGEWRKLKSEFWGVKEMQRAFDFWSKNKSNNE